jgi:putative chitinase
MLHKKYKTLFDRYGITTKDRIAHFLAQLDHESGLKPIAENLNYSAVGLTTIFKKYFNSESAKQYARSPQRIANRVYANRMGNGNEASGDGWRYRGRGFIQITGKDNYGSLSKATGVDYVANPDLLLTEADAMISALWYWDRIKANQLADEGNIREITRRINGGFNGMSDRINKLKKWKSLL